MDCSIALKFSTEFDHGTSVYYNGQRSRSQYNVTYQQYKTAMGDEIKADKDWHGIGRPQVVMHHNCHFSSLVSFQCWS